MDDDNLDPFAKSTDDDISEDLPELDADPIEETDGKDNVDDSEEDEGLPEWDSDEA